LVYIIGYIFIYRITVLREQEPADGDINYVRSAFVCLPIEEKTTSQKTSIIKNISICTSDLENFIWHTEWLQTILYTLVFTIMAYWVLQSGGMYWYFEENTTQIFRVNIEAVNLICVWPCIIN